MQQLGLSSRKTPKEESRVRALLWPDIRTSPGIHTVIDSGKLAAFAVAGITGLAVLLRWVPAASLIDAGIFTAIGFGIGKKSRICAILGLVLYLVGQVFAYWNGLGGWNMVLVIIITFFFVNSVRATFAYHRLLTDAQKQGAA